MDIFARSGPARCANHSDSMPELPYPKSCGLSLFEKTNATQTPYDVLKECCVSGQVGYYPSDQDDCYAYCNSTTQSQQQQVYQCLSTSLQLSSFGCAEGPSNDGSYTATWNWGTLLVSGLLLSVMIGL